MSWAARWVWSTAWLAVLLLGGVGRASAEVTLPDGTVVPLDSMNGEQQLFELFEDRMEGGLDFRESAHAAPDTFSPLCGFQATLLLKESGSDPGVGWYNADPNATQPPSADEIYTIIAPPTTLGETISGADIRDDPNYAGGAVGFALLTTPPHFTEARFNRVCTACTDPGPWTLALVYRSSVTSNAYYVAFEDGPTSATSYGNDGDYNDDVFLFEGVSCPGEGEACEVPGGLGVCRPGLLECEGATGEQRCRPLTQPVEEVCDDLDNDCDGEVDEQGEAPLCAPGEVCSRGTCLPRCGSFEFACALAPFTLCDEGLCIDPLCEDVRCDAGKTCVAGNCRAACDGVICPVGQTCRMGACSDPCDGVACDDMRVCDGGACVLSCECTGCVNPLRCGDSGHCESVACQGVRCAEGEYCDEGNCVDRCRDAQCPAGEVCAAGECAVPPLVVADGGSSGGGPGGKDAGANAGSGGDADAAVGGDAGKQGDAAVASEGGAGAAADAAPGGCSCRTHAGPSHGGDATWWLAWLLVAAARRRFRHTSS